jgi:hypothetical protein
MLSARCELRFSCSLAVLVCLALSFLLPLQSSSRFLSQILYNVRPVFPFSLSDRPLYFWLQVACSILFVIRPSFLLLVASRPLRFVRYSAVLPTSGCKLPVPFCSLFGRPSYFWLQVARSSLVQGLRLPFPFPQAIVYQISKSITRFN